MGIPRVRTSVVCVHQNRLLAFRAIDPTSKAEYVFLPGGKVEAHETAPEAAARETLEETGYLVIVDEHSCVDADYDFTWNGELYNCLTLFYRAELKSPFQQKLVEDADYHKGVVWIPLEEIGQRFSYSKEISESIQSLI